MVVGTILIIISRLSACLLGAIQLVAGQQGKSEMAKNATVHAQVHIGKPNGLKGFGLEVEIQIEGIEDQALIDAGHEVYLSRCSS